uniref:Uncharacterized protein n=1 Tax=Aegilops tauschii TaxID=37682 RepID=M8BRP8_AEGTA
MTRPRMQQKSKIHKFIFWMLFSTSTSRWCKHKIKFVCIYREGAPWPITATTAGRSTPPPQAVHRKNSDLIPAGSHQQRPFEHIIALLLQRGSATALGGGKTFVGFLVAKYY